MVATMLRGNELKRIFAENVNMMLHTSQSDSHNAMQHTQFLTSTAKSEIIYQILTHLYTKLN